MSGEERLTIITRTVGADPSTLGGRISHYKLEETQIFTSKSKAYSHEEYTTHRSGGIHMTKGRKPIQMERLDAVKYCLENEEKNDSVKVFGKSLNISENVYYKWKTGDISL